MDLTPPPQHPESSLWLTGTQSSQSWVCDKYISAMKSTVGNLVTLRMKMEDSCPLSAVDRMLGLFGHSFRTIMVLPHTTVMSIKRISFAKTMYKVRKQ